MEAGQGKRVRKKTKRLSESDSYGEPPKKKLKGKQESVETPPKRGKTKNQGSGAKVKQRGGDKDPAATKRTKDGKFVVSLNLGLIDSTEKRTGGNNGRGEGVATSRQAVPMKFKNPNFSVSFTVNMCGCAYVYT